MAKKKECEDRLVAFVERRLTDRNVKKYYRKEKQKRKSLIRDWGGSFLWAACVVFLINQYFFQAYNIPTPSMVHTLETQDRLFVNKLVYGPELLPGIAKLPGFAPKRNDIIVFENPEYISKGTAFDIAHRMIFMLTLSLVDIDKEWNPRTRQMEPGKHFLIKRAVGTGGDRVRTCDGRVLIAPRGSDRFFEEEFVSGFPQSRYRVRREISDETYRSESLDLFDEMVRSGTGSFRYTDYETVKTAAMVGLMMNPSASDRIHWAVRNHLGYYIPEHYKLPLGDNRDNSLDGRWFGPVKDRDIIGRAGFIYYPFSRFGLVR